jgi:hypothetical protein
MEQETVIRVNGSKLTDNEAMVVLGLRHQHSRLRPAVDLLGTVVPVTPSCPRVHGDSRLQRVPSYNLGWKSSGY